MDFPNPLIDPGIWRDVTVSAGLLVLAFAIGYGLHGLTFGILGRMTRRESMKWGQRALQYARNPSRILFPLLLLNLVAPSLRLPERPLALVNHAAGILFIASVAYLFVSLIRLLRDFLLSRHDIGVSDNLRARKVYTQIRVLEKVLFTVVAVATVSFILMTFEGVRQIGVSLLASAGIAGLVIGLAAQKSIGTMLAGIQIAITQPIRLDDVVIVENEWGRIEEITLTYVVVRIWDLRRLVVPITYFIETPFQNWTRVSADILGTVFLYTDYTIPVEAVRAETERLVKSSPLWDGKVCGLQVTDSKPDTLELRLLVSAADASKAWDLRCWLREKIVEFVQREYPASLPRVRAEMEEKSSLTSLRKAGGGSREAGGEQG
jgi:small-conductance mechanosensitive channel